MDEDTKHMDRMHELADQYKLDEEVFTKALESISNAALDILHIWPRPPADKPEGKMIRAQAIVDTEMDFPHSPWLYLERAIRCRAITPLHHQLHLPFSEEEARNDPQKEKANSGSKYRTVRHMNYTAKLREISMLLRQCKSLSDTRPSYAIRNLTPSGIHLARIFLEQEIYLGGCIVRFQRKTAEATSEEASEHEDDLANTSTFCNPENYAINWPSLPSLSSEWKL